MNSSCLLAETFLANMGLFLWLNQAKDICKDIRKKFFPLRVTGHWNRLPKEAVESPSLKILKTHLDEVLCSLL